MHGEYLSKKICENCNQEKPLSKFRANQRKDGTFSYSKKCFVCVTVWTRRNQIKIKPRRMPYQANGEWYKVCSKCNEAKKLSEYPKSSRVKFGVASVCKTCYSTKIYKKRPVNRIDYSLQKEKNCENCQLSKTLKYFSPRKRKDGTLACDRICRNCRKGTKMINQPYYDENQGKLVKLCKPCGQIKSLEDFAKQYDRFVYCRPCAYQSQKKVKERRKLSGKDKEYRNRRYRNEPELRIKRSIRAKTYDRERYRSMTPEQKKAESKRQYKYVQRRRAVKANAPFAALFTKEDIIKRDGLICYLCGKLLTESEAELEHILPISRGGSHKPENVKIACQKCNRSKTNKTLTEYKKWRGDYNRFRA